MMTQLSDVRCLYCNLLATHKCECTNPHCVAFTCDAHSWLAINPVRIPTAVNETTIEGEGQ